MEGRPPTYAAGPRKMRAESWGAPTRGWLVDSVFFAAGVGAAIWLAVLLVAAARLTWWHLLLLVPVWAMTAYLVLPRLHRLLSSLYVPPYFIGRTRTSDGLLGDPVNLALDGTAAQVHTALSAAGWQLADEITPRTVLRVIRAAVLHRPYDGAPVSPLYLFGRRQCLAYQLGVPGKPRQRHHLRVWRCPDGWLLPGGRRVTWLGAGTYDRAVGLSFYTLQLTHRIDADIDIERDFIVESVRFHTPAAGLTTLRDFSSGYHHVNGGGDRVHTDGDLPVLELDDVPPAEMPPVVRRAAAGYPDNEPDTGIASGDPGVTPVEVRRRRPQSIVLGCWLLGITVVVQLVSLALQLRHPRQIDRVWGVSEQAGTRASHLLIAATVVISVALIGLAVATYQGRARPRTWLMGVVTLSLVVSASSRVGDPDAAAGFTTLLGVAVSVLVLLAFSSDSARRWSRAQRSLRNREGVEPADVA